MNNHNFIYDNDLLYGFGTNNKGQLGSGNKNYIDVPMIILQNNSISSISCGHNFSLFLTVHGIVYASGSNNRGQLGLGDFKKRTIFTPITSHTNISQIASGSCHSYILDNSNNLFSFGCNIYGQLGINNIKKQNIPHIVTLNDIIIKKIICGNYHTFILDSHNNSFATGNNYNGQLATGDELNRKSFVLVKNNVIDIYCGWNYSILIIDNYVHYYGTPVHNNIDVYKKISIDNIKYMGFFKNNPFVFTYYGELFIWQYFNSHTNLVYSEKYLSCLSFINNDSLIFSKLNGDIFLLKSKISDCFDYNLSFLMNNTNISLINSTSVSNITWNIDIFNYLDNSKKNEIFHLLLICHYFKVFFHTNIIKYIRHYIISFIIS